MTEDSASILIPSGRIQDGLGLDGLARQCRNGMLFRAHPNGPDCDPMASVYSMVYVLVLGLARVDDGGAVARSSVIMDRAHLINPIR